MPEARQTRILLADDHALVRRGVRLILDSESDLTVVAEAADGAEAIDKARTDEPDLAILDIAMPRMTGLQAARELSRLLPDLRILILTMYDNEQYFFESLKAGASGYVLKSVADRDLVEACRAAMRGEPFLYPGAVTALIRNYLEWTRGATTHTPRPSPTAKRRFSSSSPRATHPNRSPTCCSSASRLSNATGPTCCRSSASETGLNSPATPSEPA
jgi:DNA-binding NarL/FixJ family response regulator